MKKYCLAVIIFISLLFTGCTNEDALAELPELEQVWINSYEEQISEAKIFRPLGTVDFPASRYRQAFEFKKNNSCEFRVLSPVDAHYMDIGRWHYSKNSNTIKIINSAATLVYEFEITTLTDSILKIKFKNQ